MGLTVSQRQAVTKTIAVRYQRAGRAAKGVILDELFATGPTGQDHCQPDRRALRAHF